MEQEPVRPRALLSVWDKRDIVPFASGLAELGFEVLSTGGTARTLREAGLTVTDVSQATGHPEIFDGRVKSLHPAIHGPLLARLEREDDAAPSGNLGIHRFRWLRSTSTPSLKPRRRTRPSPSRTCLK